MYLIHEFHNLSWIDEINELFHDILIYWEAPVYGFKANRYRIKAKHIDLNFIGLPNVRLEFVFSAKVQINVSFGKAAVHYAIIY